ARGIPIDQGMDLQRTGQARAGRTGRGRGELAQRPGRSAVEVIRDLASKSTRQHPEGRQPGTNFLTNRSIVFGHNARSRKASEPAAAPESRPIQSLPSMARMV